MLLAPVPGPRLSKAWELPLSWSLKTYTEWNCDHLDSTVLEESPAYPWAIKPGTGQAEFILPALWARPSTLLVSAASSMATHTWQSQTCPVGEQHSEKGSHLYLNFWIIWRKTSVSFVFCSPLPSVLLSFLSAIVFSTSCHLYPASPIPSHPTVSLYIPFHPCCPLLCEDPEVGTADERGHGFLSLGFLTQDSSLGRSRGFNLYWSPWPIMSLHINHYLLTKELLRSVL